MNYTFLDLGFSLLATIAFGCFVLPPSFLFFSWTNLLRFQTRSRAEQMLWVLGFSLPFGLFLSAIVGRFVPSFAILALFLFAAVSSSIQLFSQLRSRALDTSRVRALSPVILAVLGLAAAILLATCSIQVHSRLYESVVYSDWSVRVPLVQGAIRSGVPPANPFFTVGGEPQPCRYYYYWYVLCAQVGRFLHLPARACLTASAVWSGYALVAVLFLMLRHLLGFRPPSPRRYLLPLLLCCVMGFDVVAAVLGYLLTPPIIFPEIEWWLDDRIPSFFGAILFAPHHIAGVVCCSVAFLVLHLTTELLISTPTLRIDSVWKFRLLASITAGVCFAACAGDSTFIALCFAVAGTLYGLDLALHRRWGDLGMLCAAGLIATLISLPFLREMSSVLPGTTSTHHAILQFALRNRREKEHFAGTLVFALHGRLRDLVRPAVSPLFLVLQFGFFLVPLMMRIRQDVLKIKAGRSLSDSERLLWIIFLGAALPGFFLSSAPQGVNDLGRHAGLIMRLVLVAWAVPLLSPYADRLRRREPLSPAHPWAARIAFALFTLGLASQLWQILSERALLPFLAMHPQISSEAPVTQENDIGARFYQIRRGLESLERRLPPSAVVQSNMLSRFQPLVMFYSPRPFAAADTSCLSAFGGDPRLCLPMSLRLEALFGAHPTPGTIDFTAIALDPPLDMSDKNFERTCRDLHLAAILVQNTDQVWLLPKSWVWHAKPLYTAPLVRILSCPVPSSNGKSAPPLQSATAS